MNKYLVAGLLVAAFSASDAPHAIVEHVVKPWLQDTVHAMKRRESAVARASGMNGEPHDGNERPAPSQP